MQLQDMGTDPLAGRMISRGREVQEEEEAIGVVRSRHNGCESRLERGGD